jgi:hypothetical protein
VVVVRAPVLNEPVVPVPPPPVEVHEALSVDDQLMVVLALYAIEVEVAERVMVGALEAAREFALGAFTPPPPQEARPEIANIATNIISKTLE